MSRENKLIQFYLTDECNSRCKTCNIWKLDGNQHLDYNKVIEVIEDYPDADYVFGGGEFTLYKYNKKLLDYCKKKDVNYTILTNCISLNRLTEIVSFYEPKNVTISFDGTQHDTIRGNCHNTSRIREFIRDYKDYIPNLKLSYTLSKYNEGTIDKDMEYIKENMGFDKVYFCLAHQMDLLCTDVQEDISPSLKSVKHLVKHHKDMLYDKDYNFLRNLLGDVKKPCTSTDNVHTIYSNGDVVLCQSFMSSRVIGNICRSRLSDILESWNIQQNMMPFKCGYEYQCNLVCQRRYD